MHLAVAHGWSVAQPHLITLSTSIGTRATPSDIVTGSSDLEASSFSQPKCVGASSRGSFSNAAFHTDTWKCARLTFCRMLRMLAVGISALARQSLSSLMSCQSIPRIWLQTYFRYLHIHSTLQQTGWPQVILRPLASPYYPSLDAGLVIYSGLHQIILHSPSTPSARGQRDGRDHVEPLARDGVTSSAKT